MILNTDIPCAFSCFGKSSSKKCVNSTLETIALISIKPSLKMTKTLKGISGLTVSQRQLLHFLKGLLFLASEFVFRGNRECVLSQGQ